MSDINWDGLKSRNLFADYQGGLAVGREMRDSNAKRDALNVFATDPARAEQMLIGAGDIASAEALARRAERERQMKARGAAQTSIASGDYKGARQTAIGAGDFDLANSIAKLDSDQREMAATQADELAGFAQHLKGLDPTARRDAIAHAAPLLMERGFSEQQLQSFDPTDQGLDTVIGQAMDLKTALAQSNKDRDHAFDQEKFGETKRSNRANEGLRQQSNATSAYGAQTSRMSYEARKKAGGFGTPGVGGVVPDDDVEIDQ